MTATLTNRPRVTIDIPFVIECVSPSRTLQVAIYDAVEFLRLADIRLGEMIDALDDEEAEEAELDLDYLTGGDFDYWYLRAAQVNCRLFARLLAETFGGVLPSIPDRVFKVLREYENRWPTNQTGVEGTSHTLGMAQRALHKAWKISGDEADDLDDLILGACDVLDLYADVFSGGVTSSDEVIQAILDGGPLPPFSTQADVDAYRAYRRAEDTKRRQEWKDMEALKAAAGDPVTAAA